MSRVADVQQFVDAVRHVPSPKALEQCISDVAREMGFDGFTMFHHVDLSTIVASYRHMQKGDLIGITTAPVGWSEYYRDNNLVAVDPRVLATRRTMCPFSSEEIGRLIRVTPAQRAVVEGQQRANLGQSFIVPVHFPGEPSGSCTFSMALGRSLPRQNFAMASWIGCAAFQAGRNMLVAARNTGRFVAAPRLTQRQLECTVLVAQGLCDGAIAKRLGISRETVKRHLKAARFSCGVAKSVQLVTHSLHNGQISLLDIMPDHCL